MATILVTGAAGFIGSSVARALLARGDHVIGIDNLNAYYDVTLKEARLARLTAEKNFTFRKLDIADRDGILKLAEEFPGIDGIIHLAAQAGVRHSLTDPYAYVTSNVMGQTVMLELARKLKSLKHFVYASSSSVYGGNTKLPFSVDDPVEQPNSLYAATKRADELFGYTYAHLYGIPADGAALLHGLWSLGPARHGGLHFHQGDHRRRADQGFQPRRDVARLHLYRRYREWRGAGAGPPRDRNAAAQDLQSGQSPLGKAHRFHRRDRTGPAAQGQDRSWSRCSRAMWRATYADIEASRRDLGFEPTTPISAGIPKFIAWYKDYYGV